MKYLIADRGQINPKIKVAQKFMFDISSIPILTAIQYLIKCFLNIYHKSCENWSPSLISNLNNKIW